MTTLVWLIEPEDDWWRFCRAWRREKFVQISP